MSNEQQPRRNGEHEDPYFNIDEQMGEARLWGHEYMLCLQAHVGEEAYSHSAVHPLSGLRRAAGHLPG